MPRVWSRRTRILCGYINALIDETTKRNLSTDLSQLLLLLLLLMMMTVMQNASMHRSRHSTLRRRRQQLLTPPLLGIRTKTWTPIVDVDRLGFHDHRRKKSGGNISTDTSQNAQKNCVGKQRVPTDRRLFVDWRAQR
jgi:hypothetical protein